MKATEEYNENNPVKSENSETARTENKSKYIAASLAGLVTSGGLLAFALKEDDTDDGGATHSANNAGADSAGKSEFEQAFATARAEQGKGGVFEHEGNYYGTYYKDEWDALSKEEKDQFYASANSKIQNNPADTAENDLLPEEAADAQVEVIKMASQVTDEMSPEMALHVAREEVGPGNIYAYRGEVYSTYTADELLNLSPEEIERARYIMEQVNLNAQILTKEDIQGEETIFDTQALAANTDTADTEVIDTEVADTETADTEVADINAIDNTADADTAGEQIDYNENEGEESIDTQETEGGDEIEYVVKVKSSLLSSSDNMYDNSEALDVSDADFDNPLTDPNNEINTVDNL
ncbi:MAG: hypothetical protein LBJ60_02540 [Tannerellaceae bacterium]|jgi:hypothetical protein|nr:hypothetical protein [Tannerellaceae bacterium]